MKTEIHTIYRTNDGKVVPGVTTIIENNLGWNKHALIAWAQKTVMAGKDPGKVRDLAGDIGALAHYLILCHLRGKEPDTSEYSRVTIEKAENAFLAFLGWEDLHRAKVVEMEKAYVSEKHYYGGTLDLVAEVDGELALVDFKSSNGLYPEHRIQLGAYQQLYREAHGLILVPHLLQIGKEDGSFHHHRFSSLEPAWEGFLCCLRLHQLKSKLR